METTQLAKLFFDMTDDFIFMVSVEGAGIPFIYRLQAANPAYLRLIGKTEAVFGKPVQDVLDEDVSVAMLRQVEEVLSNGQPYTCDETIRFQGSELIIETKLTPFFTESGKPDRILGVSRDITARRLFERYIRESEERYRTLVQLSPDSIIIHDEGKIIYCNEAAAKLVQADHPDELLGTHIMDYIPKDERRSMKLHLKRIYPLSEQTGKLPMEMRIVKRNGEMVEVEINYAIVEYNSKKVLQVILRDITKRSEERKRLKRLSQLDGLTNIANRRYFDTVLQREVSRARRNKLPISLILFDIDNFKQYNDCYGHLAGDECLKRVTEAAAAKLKRPGDLIARFGGEEFAVLLPETDSYGAETVAELLRKEVEQLAIPHMRSNVLPVVTISLGIASMNRPSAADIPNFINRADQALYTAKHKGKNRYEIT